MRRVHLAVLTATVLLAMGATIGAQARYSQVLVGKWEGTVRFPAVRDNPGRTLIVDSVSEGDGPLTVKGKFGPTGQGLSAITGTLETSGGPPRLLFTSGGNFPVVLELHGDRDLVGTMTILGGMPREMRLKKVD